MKKDKPKIIKDAKARGEWAESVFMERAAGLGLTVSKPWGESSSFDLVVGSPGRFVGVQVKSTVCESGGGYECCIRGRQQKAYARGSFDFLAAYVVPEDVWYIIPAESVRGKETVCLCSDSKYAKYEEYREAWELLREAQGGREQESVVPEAEVEEPVRPAGALGRMEASFNFMRNALERGVGGGRKSDS